MFGHMFEVEDDRQFAFHVRADVPVRYRVPAALSAILANRNVAKLYGTIGRWVNAILALTKTMNDQGYNHKKEIEDIKKTIRKLFYDVEEELANAGQNAFGMPVELVEAFEDIGLKWPPVAVGNVGQ